MAVRNFGTRRRKQFLHALSMTGNISAAARAVGVSRSTAYAARSQDERFAAAWAEALEEAVDALAYEARRRAIEGIAIPHFFGGKVAGTVTKYSDSLLMFLLRAHRPETYRDVVKNEGQATPMKGLGAHAQLAMKLQNLAEQSPQGIKRQIDPDEKQEDCRQDNEEKET